MGKTEVIEKNQFTEVEEVKNPVPKQFEGHLFKPGQSGNPSGRPPGSGTAGAWAMLRDSITNKHSAAFNSYLGGLWHTDPEKAAILYLKVLEFFKPKMASTSVHGAGVEFQPITIQIGTGEVIPNLPSDIDGGVTDPDP